MNKLFLMGAVASLGLLASCSSDDDLSSGSNGDNGLQQIKIGMGVQANVATRGTGAVGGVSEAENVWANQLVNVFMLNKGSLGVAQFNGENIYDNAEFTTPNATDSGIATELKSDVAQYKYYPVQGAYDFWGYRLDDANDATDENDQEGNDTQVAISEGKYVPYTTYINNDSLLLIGFKIDGSQDIMAGKATPTGDEITKCNGEQNIYSAYAARRDVQPNIKFEHLLSQLNFQVLAGAKETTNEETGVYVTRIKVYSKSTGKLVIAYKNGDSFVNVADQLIPDEVEEDATLTPLEVKQRVEGATKNVALEALKEVRPKWNNGVAMATEVGTGLLAIPAGKYKIEIDLKQKVQVRGDEGSTEENDYDTKTYTYEATLTNTNDPEVGFQAGYAYNVTITIYGLSQIKLTTTLSPWKDGGNIEMNPEDNFFGDENTNKDWELKVVTIDNEDDVKIAATYTTYEDFVKDVAPNASNAGKIYKVGSDDDDWVFYQCLEKVQTPTPAPVTYKWETYTLEEGESAETTTYASWEDLEEAVVVANETNYAAGKIYAVGTDPENYTYYKIVASTTDAGDSTL